MASYEVTLRDRTVECVEGVDAYQQEGPMTTFFATRPDRSVVDCWSDRIASFRTSEVLIIRRLAERDHAGGDRDLAPGLDGPIVLSERRTA